MKNKLLQKLFDLKNQRAGHLTAAQDALDAGDTAAYATAFAQATAINSEIDQVQNLLNELGRYGSEPMPAPQTQQEPQAVTELRASNEYARAFSYAIRNRIAPDMAGQHEQLKPLLDALTEVGGSPEGANGGFLVPVDLQTRINEVMRNTVRLAELFNHETTTTRTGFRVYDTAPTKGFTKLSAEMAEIAQDDQPKFSRVPYAVEDYALIVPVSNDLLADNTAGLFAYLARWCGEKAVLTENLALLALLKTLSATDIAAGEEIKGVKTALNVALKPQVSQRAVIITNQDGYNVLDNLTDTTGRPLIQPDLREPEFDRFRGRNRIIVLDNAVLPTATNKAPVYIGDFTQFGTLISRQPMEFASTNIGGKAWSTNSTEVRCIMRFDEIKTDEAAAVARTLATAGA